jgi:membrane protein YqaA with SNARE-associated domain
MNPRPKTAIRISFKILSFSRRRSVIPGENEKGMDAIINHLFALLIRLGMFGLLIFSALDSSFLDLPLGNDLLLVALTARQRHMLPVFAAMATLGSVIGCWLVDLLARKGGEQGLKKIIPGRQLDYVKRKVRHNAAWALAFASIMPPPFPFTPFVAAAAAFQYPRQKLLGVIAVSRLVRFSAVGLLAIFFPESILRLVRSSTVRTAILVLVVISIVASVLSILTWIRRGRKAPARGSVK